MSIRQERSLSRVEFTRRLTEAGFGDFIVIDRETAKSILTEKRLELLETLREIRPGSVSELAHSVDRDKAAVSRDLDLLFERDLIEYERVGNRKIPTLKHDMVVVEPIL